MEFGASDPTNSPSPWKGTWRWRWGAQRRPPTFPLAEISARRAAWYVARHCGSWRQTAASRTHSWRSRRGWRFTRSRFLRETHDNGARWRGLRTPRPVPRDFDQSGEPPFATGDFEPQVAASAIGPGNRSSTLSINPYDFASSAT